VVGFQSRAARAARGEAALLHQRAVAVVTRPVQAPDEPSEGVAERRVQLRVVPFVTEVTCRVDEQPREPEARRGGGVVVIVRSDFRRVRRASRDEEAVAFKHLLVIAPGLGGLDRNAHRVTRGHHLARPVVVRKAFGRKGLRIALRQPRVFGIAFEECHDGPRRIPLPQL